MPYFMKLVVLLVFVTYIFSLINSIRCFYIPFVKNVYP